MRTRLLRLGFAAVLPLVIAPLTNLPAAHADEDAGVGYWRNMPPRFAQRQKAGAALGVLEDDKTIDPSTKGGTVSFNPANMETKCTVIRNDGDAPKSASGSANYIQPYKWSPGIDGGGPPSSAFTIDKTKGGECNASPVRDSNITDAYQKTGYAKGTSSGADDADNDSLVNSHKSRETTDYGVIVLVVYNANGEVEQPVATSASASASSMSITPTPPRSGDPDAPPPPPPTPTYPNKGCSAEGRAYWKFTKGIPYNP